MREDLSERTRRAEARRGGSETMAEITKNEEIVTKVQDRYSRIAEKGNCGTRTEANKKNCN